MTATGLTVVALGGNAILRADQYGTASEQRANLQRTAAVLANLVQRGERLLLTHGNGPQVGAILLQNEEGARSPAGPPAMPLDVCGAESQGMLGHLIVEALRGALAQLSLATPVVSLLTHTLVAADDPAWTSASKPVGPYYQAETAARLATERGWNLREIPGGHGWRRVVPSPEPLAITELEAIRRLAEAGVLVVAGGGGGVPVVARDGAWYGVEAVIDKDLAAARLALGLGPWGGATADPHRRTGCGTRLGYAERALAPGRGARQRAAASSARGPIRGR